MPNPHEFHQNVLFSTIKLDPEKVPRRCMVCGSNPSLFEYQRHAGSDPRCKEMGSCCTACAFNMLLQLADEETREWAALAAA